MINFALLFSESVFCMYRLINVIPHSFVKVGGVFYLKSNKNIVSC